MSTLTVILTRDCNFRCDYCFENKKSAKMSVEVADKILDFLKINNIHSLSFFGGEPLLNFDIVKYIVTRVNSLGLKIQYSLITNGYLLTDTILQYLKENRFQLAISFDGINHNNRRVTCIGEDTTLQTYDTIKLAIKNKMFFTVCMVACRDNLKGLAEDILDLYKIGVPKIDLALKSNHELWDEMDYILLEEELETALDNCIPFIKAGRIFYFDNLYSLALDIRNKTHMSKHKCDVCYENLVVDTDGSLYPCMQFFTKDIYQIGSIFYGIDIKKVKISRRLFIKPLLRKKCNKCSMIDFCNNNCACRNVAAMDDNNPPCNYLKLKLKLANKLSTIL